MPVTKTTLAKGGIDLPQGVPTFHTLNIPKNIIDQVIASKLEEGLTVTYDFSYSDWTGDKTYKYRYSFLLVVTDKEPLSFQIMPISNP